MSDEADRWPGGVDPDDPTVQRYASPQRPGPHPAQPGLGVDGSSVPNFAGPAQGPAQHRPPGWPSPPPYPPTAAASPPGWTNSPPPQPGLLQPWPNAFGPPQPPPFGWTGPAPYPPPPPSGPRHGKRWAWLALGAVGLVVVVVTALVVSSPDPEPVSAPPTVALTELDDGVRIGYPSVPVTIDVFDEPLCPPCSRFVTSSNADIERAVSAKKVAVRYHLLNFLDHGSSSHDYSTRAVAATLCVAALNDPALYTNFYVDLFAPSFQPVEGASTDRTDTELADLAASVGAAGARGCIENGELLDAARTKATNGINALQRLAGTVGTPTVYDGTTVLDIKQSGWVNRLTKGT